MENIAPSLVLLWDVKRALESGRSVHTGVRCFLQRREQNSFHLAVGRWWAFQNNSQVVFDRSTLAPQRKYLLDLLEMGLKGHPILENLKNTELELISSCENEIENHISRLPLILMLPLMGLVFPATMWLLVAPLIKLLSF